jgi:selenium-binding protein 1
MSQMLDRTLYRSPADVNAAAPERLACVAAFDPASVRSGRKAKDAITVINCDPSSPGYARWSAGANCPPPAMSCTISAGTLAPAPCATRAS